MHLRREKPDKNKLEPLYDDVSKVGQVARLSPLFNILLRMFRENISPSGGNNDALRGGLVELMFLAYRCSINENLRAKFTLDVMHYIFEDMYEAVLKRKCPPYAPYIMMLIKTKLGYDKIEDGNSDVDNDCVKHSVRKLYVKKRKGGYSSCMPAGPSFHAMGGGSSSMTAGQPASRRRQG